MQVLSKVSSTFGINGTINESFSLYQQQSNVHSILFIDGNYDDEAVNVLLLISSVRYKSYIQISNSNDV